MENVSVVVVVLTALLALAVMFLPISRRFNFPYTVMLALVGIIIGFVIHGLGQVEGPRFVGELVDAVKNVGITSGIVFFIFLPALIFESALAIDVRRLIDDLAPILLLAVIGLLISTFVVGYSMSWVSGIAILPCLLLGAIVSATDPVAVVAIFKDLGVPKRLAILVEGESLFNDATAIVLFTILAAMIASGADVDLGGAIMAFVKVFLGGVVVGYLMARALCWLIPRLGDVPLVEVTLTISLAYLSFAIAEHYVHVSGVMAVVSAALVMGSRGRTILSPSTWQGLTETWKNIGFWANSLIFIMVGLIVPTLLAQAGWQELGWLVVLVSVAFVARAVIIFGGLPLLNPFKAAGTVSNSFKTVMLWGGLRGAVSLALALTVLEAPGFEEQIKTFISIMVTGFVLFTLFINAPTMGRLMDMLGLNQLSPVDLAIRNRAMALSLNNIRDALETVGKGQDMRSDVVAEFAGHYSTRLADADKEMQDLEDVSDEQWLSIGLRALMDQERKTCLGQFADGVISSNVTRLHLAVTDNILDAIKARGMDGYRDAVAASLSFPPRFRLALQLQRRFGITGPLTRQLSDRFEVLRAKGSALRRVRESGLSNIASLVGSEVTEQLKQLLDDRIDGIDRAQDAVRLQYPDYARALEELYLARIALRLEEADYKAMLDDSVISHDVFSALSDAMEKRRGAVHQRLELDLGLEPEALVAKVPLFADLGTDRIREIAKLLKPRLIVPDEMVVQKGDAGDAMYFISSGSLRVELETGPLTLGSGSFFGEMALINAAPRVADVAAMGFCQLLRLDSGDFRRLLDSNPVLKETITAIARERAAEGGAATKT